MVDGDELPEGRQLLRLGEPLAQLLPLGFEPGLRRQVARDDHAAHPFPPAPSVPNKPERDKRLMSDREESILRPNEALGTAVSLKEKLEAVRAELENRPARAPRPTDNQSADTVCT